MIKQKGDKISSTKEITKNVCVAHDLSAEAQAHYKNLAWIVVFYLVAIILEMVYI